MPTPLHPGSITSLDVQTETRGCSHPRVSVIDWKRSYLTLSLRALPGRKATVPDMGNPIEGSPDREVTVYFDEDCTICRTGIHLLHRVLFLRRTQLIPGQQVPDVDEVMRTGNTWVVVDQFGQTHTEFDALTCICRQSPVFWPLSNLLRVPPIPQLGGFLYRFIASHRRGFWSRSASE